MRATKLDEKFFESTRGQIVSLLRGNSRTVEELAAELKLTHNAVRAHLSTLERDGLVKQRGVRRGLRKPHYTYTLSHEAEELFPKAYDLLLNQLIHVLKDRIPRGSLEDILREVGNSLAARQTPGAKKESLESRARRAVEALAQLGGKALVEKKGDDLLICSDACPLASAVAEHPEVCLLAETLIAQIVGAEVKEQCDRVGTPKCLFVISE
ncbi:MAG: ArsR family transcriptional regulator [Acidobacteriota bacterium]|nr:ArsR family transcriptional regulator [Acidobacteriota bacterium]